MKFNMDIPPKKEEGEKESLNESDDFLRPLILSKEEIEELDQATNNLAGVSGDNVDHLKSVNVITKYLINSEELNVEKFILYLFERINKASFKDTEFVYFWINEIKSLAETEAVMFYDKKEEEKDYFTQFLKKIRNNKELSFLFYLIAQKSINELDKIKENGEESFEGNDLPFEISYGQYVLSDGKSNKDLYILDKNFDKKTIFLLKELEKQKENVDFSDLNYCKENEFLNLKTRDIYKYLYSVSHKISHEDVSLLKKEKNDSTEKIRNFIKIIDLGIISLLEKELDIDFKELSIQKQFHFLEFLCNIKTVDFSNIKKFIKKYSYDGIKSFLSLESGGMGMSDKIIILGEKLPEDSAKAVFEKYSEIVDATEGVYEFLRQNFKKEVDFEIVQKISESLLLRAKEMLTSYHDKKDISEKDVLSSLERFKTEILLYADTYKELKKEGVIFSLEDLDQTKITELSLEERKEMSDELWEITKTNREKFITDPVSMKKREERFRYSLGDANVEFLTLKHKENIIAFCSLEKDKEGKYLIESLNVESQIKGSNIGGAFLPSVIKDCLEKGKEVYGYVHNGNKGTLPYYERIGFSVNEVEKDGELFYEIRIKPNQDQ